MGKFIDALLNGATAGAGSVVGAGMGMLFGGTNDRRQRRQQQALTDQQVGASKQLMDYQNKKAMEMWEATNYKAQMDQLRAAGLNPALVYGMSGGGGQSTGNAGATAQGGQAAGVAGENVSGMGMGIQMGIAAAQKEVLEAQAENLRADAENKRGVEREVGTAQAGSLTQGMAESKARTALIGVEEATAEIKRSIAADTMNLEVSRIKSEVAKARELLWQAENDTDVSDRTVKTKVLQARANVIETIARGALLRTEKYRTEKMLPLEMAESISRKSLNIIKWNEVNWNASREDKRAKIQEELKDLEVDWKAMDTFIDLIEDVLWGAGSGAPKRNPIGFK